MKKIIAIALMLLSFSAIAGERYYKTEGGLVTLTTEPCNLEFEGVHTKDYKIARAVTNEGKPVPDGCWVFEEEEVEGKKVVSIAIYVPSLDVTFTYNPQLFSYEKPEVKGEF